MLGKKKADPMKPEEAPSLEGLTKVFGDMTKQFESLPAQVSRAVSEGINSAITQQREVDATRRREADEADEADRDDGSPAVNAIDLEKMSRAEFMAHISKGFEKTLQKNLGSFQKTLNSNVESIERDKVQARFNEARKAHSDFDEWKTEMGTLVKSHGYLDPEELYILARAKNSEKAKKIDDEMNKAIEEAKIKDEKEKEPAGRTRFLGLMPTSGGARLGSEESPKYETTKEAAAAAFDEVMGNIPESLIGEASQT